MIPEIPSHVRASSLFAFPQLTKADYGNEKEQPIVDRIKDNIDRVSIEVDGIHNFICNSSALNK